MFIYTAIDLNKNGSPCTVTTHASLEEAQKALHFRMQCNSCDSPFNNIEWVAVYKDDLKFVPCYWIPKGYYEDKCIIYNTLLGDLY